MSHVRPRRRESPVPAILLALYEGRNRINPNQLGNNDRERTDAIALLLRLITDTEIKRAWRRLAHYSNQIKRKSGQYDYGSAVFFVCLTSINDWRSQRKDWVRARGKTLAKIGTMALKLSRLLEATTDFRDCSVERFMHQSELTALGGSVICFPTMQFKKPLRRDFKGRILVDTFVPSVPKLLHRIDALAKKIAKQPKPVGQPGSRRAEAHFVALALSRHFQYELGKELHGLVAIITNAAVKGSALDSDSVRKLTRHLRVPDPKDVH